MDPQIGRGHFMLGDCLERMTEIRDASVDMIITSPPYDNLRTYNDSAAWTWDVFVGVARECARLLKLGGTIVWNVGDATIKGSETGTSFRQALHFKDGCGLNLHDTMIWVKPGGGAVGSQLCYNQSFEYVFVFSKGKLNKFNPIMDRENVVKSGKVAVNAGRHRSDFYVREIERKPFGKRTNVWAIAPQKMSDHPAPFPVSFAQDHILSWSNKNDLILDPFAGSGTTAIASERTGRRWICIERDPEYYSKAYERVENEIVSKGLFS